ncbi:Sulfur carrier protein ThiS [compost metagenome]|uniref:sulfur carrier protein ThiS n=1 Tax=Paenibacillus sp. GD4 TaxID=3068890 RepID=UPI000FC3AFD8|nr:sulfur carrier protein ThiS [Paenibacillus sp. GD4]MDQ1911880.1 sulfur carrier protein ThiS [Paenibacillus sp. GD4]
MQLTVNGDIREVTDVTNVLDLLKAFKLDQKILVVELNRTIIDRERYEETALKDGDRIEIVHFVGGG